MNLLIVGSRNIKSFDISPYIPKDTGLIITGGAIGIDRLAEKYADDHKISKLILRPQYCLYKKAAPLKRNEKMVDIADKIIVIWDGKSKGSKYTADYAQKTNKDIKLIIWNNNLT